MLEVWSFEGIWGLGVEGVEVQTFGSDVPRVDELFGRRPTRGCGRREGGKLREGTHVSNAVQQCSLVLCFPPCCELAEPSSCEVSTHFE